MPLSNGRLLLKILLIYHLISYFMLITIQGCFSGLFFFGGKQCFLLQLINSAQAEKLTSFSSSMIKVFQRGLLSARFSTSILIVKKWSVLAVMIYKIFEVLICQICRENEPPKLTENGFQFLVGIFLNLITLLAFQISNSYRWSFPVNSWWIQMPNFGI